MRYEITFRLTMASMALLLIIGLIGCTTVGKDRKAGDAKAVFDARNVEAGATIANMTIKEKNISLIEDDPQHYYAIVKFSGETTVKGMLIFAEDANEGWGYGNVFSPNSDSANLIPTLDINPARNVFTVIDDENKSLGTLKQAGSKYEVKIVIQDYEIYETGKGQENVAKLVRVLNSKKLE